MTKEEELAEEYLIKRLKVDVDEFEKAKEVNGDTFKLCIDCFLAGLKAKTQWHDLREDPDDLPKDRHSVWIVYLNGYCQKEETVASYRHKYWVISGHKTECKIIAWCELPTFKE